MQNIGLIRSLWSFSGQSELKEFYGKKIFVLIVYPFIVFIQIHRYYVEHVRNEMQHMFYRRIHNSKNENKIFFKRTQLQRKECWQNRTNI